MWAPHCSNFACAGVPAERELVVDTFDYNFGAIYVQEADLFLQQRYAPPAKKQISFSNAKMSLLPGDISPSRMTTDKSLSPTQRDLSCQLTDLCLASR